MSTPCVFLSWSGNQSQVIAEAFSELFKAVFDPTIDCFISTRDIRAGARSIQTLFEMLGKCNYGICFINSENARAPWIQFEAGALSKIVDDSRVMVLLLDNNVESLHDTPLSEFQYKLFNKEHIRSVFEEIIALFELNNHKDSFLKRFDISWDSFDRKAAEIFKDSRVEKQNKNSKQHVEKDELNTIKKMLVDVQNLLKTEYVQTVRESSSLVSELKKVLQNISPDDVKNMRMHFKVQRYEMAFRENIEYIEDIMDDLESDSGDSCNLSVEKIKEKLSSIIGRTTSLIDD